MDDGDAVEDKAVEAPILGEATAMWQAIARRFRQAFLIRLLFRGGTQEADVTALIDHEAVLDRVARLLAPVAFPLVLGSGGELRGPRPTCL